MIDIQSPEIQTMYSLNVPVSAIRTKIRQQFEKHRYVSQINVVDVLLYKSHAEFQVRISLLLKKEFGVYMYMLILVQRVGNIELLETIIPCHEVFPCRGGACC